jgi:hypothetical protein
MPLNVFKNNEETKFSHKYPSFCYPCWTKTSQQLIMIHNLLLPIGMTIDWLHEQGLIHIPSIRNCTAKSSRQETSHTTSPIGSFPFRIAEKTAFAFNLRTLSIFDHMKSNKSCKSLVVSASCKQVYSSIQTYFSRNVNLDASKRRVKLSQSVPVSSKACQ